VTPDIDAQASGADGSRARSFGVRVNRRATGEMVYHEWPITEVRARWRASSLVDPKRIVTVETFEGFGARLIHEEVVR